MAASLKEFGFRQPIVVDGADVGGMHRQGFDLARDKAKSKPTTKKPGEPGT